jgi:hypothetical protein
MAEILDTASIGGTASNLVISPIWDWAMLTSEGTAVNSGNLLITNATGCLTLDWQYAEQQAGRSGRLEGIAYSFDYTVNPGLPLGEVFEVKSGSDPAYNKMDGLPAPLTLVVPEPVTIALLGLGGLFLRRRK